MIRQRLRGGIHPDAEGSLGEHPLSKLLEVGRAQRVTGALRIQSWGREGTLRWRAGSLLSSEWGQLSGDSAMHEMLALADGMFEWQQDTPAMTPAERSSGRGSLPRLVEQCRERALSCRISASARGRSIELRFTAGTLEHLRIDGNAAAEAVAEAQNDPRALAQLVASFDRAEIRVETPKLDLVSAPTQSASAEVPKLMPAARRVAPTRSLKPAHPAMHALPPPPPSVPPPSSAPPPRHASVHTVPSQVAARNGIDSWLDSAPPGETSGSWASALLQRQRDPRLSIALAVFVLSLLLLIGGFMAYQI